MCSRRQPAPAPKAPNALVRSPRVVRCFGRVALLAIPALLDRRPARFDARQALRKMVRGRSATDAKKVTLLPGNNGHPLRRLSAAGVRGLGMLRPVRQAETASPNIRAPARRTPVAVAVVVVVIFGERADHDYDHAGRSHGKAVPACATLAAQDPTQRKRPPSPGASDRSA